MPLNHLPGGKIKPVDGRLAQAESHHPQFTVACRFHPQCLVNLRRECIGEINLTCLFLVGRNLDNSSNFSRSVRIDFSVHHYELALRRFFRSLHQLHFLGFQVQAIHSRVVTQIHMRLIQHGNVRGPVNAGQIRLAQCLLFLQGLGIHHNQHAVVFKFRTDRILITVLRDDINLTVVKSHILCHISQFRTVDRLIRISYHIPFGGDVSERTILGRHVSFVQHKNSFRVGKRIQAIKFHRFRYFLVIFAHRLQRNFCLLHRLSRSLHRDSARLLIHFGCPAFRHVCHGNRFHMLCRIFQFALCTWSQHYRTIGFQFCLQLKRSRRTRRRGISISWPFLFTTTACQQSHR